MKIKLKYKLECLIGFFGIIFSSIFLFLAAIITPGYSPFLNTVSSLGRGIAKSLYSIAFVIAGTSGIPFYIYLERELVNVNENIRRFATGASIFTCICIALVGIIPDETYVAAFVAFHGFVAATAFIGSSLYIVLYSYLMYLVPKSSMYKGPAFKKYLAIYGFIIGIVLIFLLIFFNPLTLPPSFD